MFYHLLVSLFNIQIVWSHSHELDIMLDTGDTERFGAGLGLPPPRDLTYCEPGPTLMSSLVLPGYSISLTSVPLLLTKKTLLLVTLVILMW